MSHQKVKDEKFDKKVTVNDNFLHVYQGEVESWRKELKAFSSDKILVAFAWCHEEELQLANMFPEFLACNVTFGVTKEQINLFLIAGI